MRKNLLVLLSAAFCHPSSNAQNYLDNYIGNTVTLTTIGTSTEQINQPRDLDFKPNTNELWVANLGDINGGTNVIFYNAGLPNQTSEYRKDTHTGHFMRNTSAFAFGDNGMFACVSEIQNTNASSPTFMGPALWLSDTNIFARVFQNNWVNGYPLGSHSDMLHQSPFAMGIAHDTLKAYWVMDGYNGNICKYDFVTDHSPGYDDHSAGKIWRYTDITVTRVANVPSHMVLDKTNNWLYFINGGTKAIKRMNTATGNNVGNLTPPGSGYENLAGYYQMTGATVQTLATLTTQPCGMDYYNDRLVVSDYTNGNIYLYSTSPSFALLGTITTSRPGMMGVKVGPDGHIWCVNYTDNKVYRLDVIAAITDAAVISIDAPEVENDIASYYSPSFNVCSANISPTVTVKNTGTTSITSVSLQYIVDAATPVAYTWNGTLAAGSTQSVSMPTSATVVTGSHILSVKILSVNSAPDAVDLNNTLNGAFRTVDPPMPLPFNEGFSSTTFPPAGWNYSHFNKFCFMSRATVGGFGASVGSMEMDNFTGAMNISGQKDYLISPPIDFSAAALNTYLRFSVAHAQYSTSTDALQVTASSDCGNTWTQIYYKSGSTLSTAPASNNAWTPTSTQWRRDSVNVGAYMGQSEVIFMFTTISNYGNNVYVDDIYIPASPTGISSADLKSSFNIFPNPATDNVQVAIISENNVSAIIELINVTGKLLYSENRVLTTGENNFQLSLKGLNLSSGIYFIRLNHNQTVINKKLIVQ